LKTVGIKIIGRGEEIEYKSGGKLLFAERTFIDGSRFFPDSVKKWNDGKELSEAECIKAFTDIVDFLTENNLNPIIVINTDDEKMKLWQFLCNERKLEIEWTSNLEIEKRDYEHALEFFQNRRLLTEERKVLRTREEFEEWWLRRKTK
jgi:hypothetical protein